MSHLREHLTNPVSALVAAALRRRCELCHAQPGQHCHNLAGNTGPLPGGRIVHFTRLTT
ncbi:MULTISPECIES: zinc finger domain-containing protein [Mycobacterium]|uniref:zinc finger domain-containing protein n=1 Tax=Mycobacterium TaxID=1763 RepID=UPI001EF0B79F|nr:MULTISPECIES: hypothetical protein [Mycobacterium]